MPISSFLIRALLPSAAAAAATNPNGVYQIPLQPIPNAGYGAQCSVGTPPQIVTIPIDLDSSILALPSNNACKDLSCSGSFDNTTSSTCKYVSDKATDLLKGDDSLASDSIHIGNMLIKSLTFSLLDKGSQSQPASGSQPAYGAPPSTAYPQRPSAAHPGPVSHPPPTGYAPSYSQPGLLGLGPPRGPNSFLQQLLDLGIILSPSFSLYFADELVTTSSLLIGGVDTAKQAGIVLELPLVDSDLTAINAINIVKTTLQILNSDGKTYSTKPYLYPENSHMSLDTTSPLWSLPHDTFISTAQHFGVENANPAGGFPVDCKYQAPSKDVLNMDFGDNKVLTIPLNKLVTKAEDGTCSVPISGEGSSLGLGFLRQVMTVFNYETKTVKISQVQHTKDSSIYKI